MVNKILTKCREKLEAEQREILSKFGEEITMESLQASKKMDFAVRETLRMYPPLILIMRKVSEN